MSPTDQAGWMPVKSLYGCWLLLLCTLLCLPALAWSETTTGSAKTESLYFTHLKTDDGLSHNETTSIVQDDKGFIWIATTYGLNRYDGTSIVTFLHENNNPNSLPGNYLWDLRKGHNDVLWISTWGAGLSLFDLKTETFTNYSHDENNPESLGDNQVWSTYEDSKGRIWVATMAGLSQLDRATGVFTHYLLPGPNGEPQGATRMAEDQHGFLWVGTYGGGLHRFNPDTGKSASYFHDEKKTGSINSNIVLSVYIDPQQTVWAGTSKGLARLPHDQQHFIRYQSNPEDPESLGNNYIWSILEARSGNLWLGTESGGLSIFDPEAERFSNHYPDPHNQNSVSDPSVPSAYQDKNGYIWLATYDGVDIYNPDYPRFFSLPKQSNTLDVRAVYQNAAGILWLGTSGSGLYRFDPDKNSLENYPRNAEENNYVSAIHPGDGHTLWLGITGKGLTQFNTLTGHFDFYPLPQNDQEEDVGTIYTLASTQGSQTLWVGSARLYPFDLRSKQFEPFPSAPDWRAIAWVNSLLPDKAGNLWIGADGGMLTRFNPETGIFDTSFSRQTTSTAGLSSSLAESLYQDSRGKLWIGTANGLNMFDPATRTFKTYFDTDGLGSNRVASIIEDQQHKLWIATNKGLSRFDPETGQFKNYDQQSGINNKDFNARSVFMNSDGELFFGGSQGLTFFNPASLKKNQQPPNIVITNLQLVHQTLKPGLSSPIKQDIAYLDSLTLAHEKNNFSFEFVAVNYWSGNKNRYAYQLEGFDKEWIYTDSQNRVATYTNTAPGTYTFRVKASNNDGVWNEQGTSLQVVILPPWWQTVWFNAFSLMLFSASLWLLYQWRIRAIRHHNRQLEEQVQSRTQELQEAKNAREQFIATMNHELRTPMHAITSITTLLKLTELNERQQQYISRLSSASRHMMQTIGNILDLSKIRSGHFELHDQPFHLGLAVENTMAILEPLAQQKNLAFMLEGGELLDVTVQGDRRYLSQILLNLLGNSLKNTADGHVTLKVREDTAPANQQITRQFAVEDSGCGIPPDKLASLFEPYQQINNNSGTTRPEGTGLGLPISQALVTLMGGELSVNSEQGKGSCFRFSLTFDQATALAPTELMSGEDISNLRLPAGLRILLVDDAEINRFVGQAMLNNMGAEVTLANDGEQALLYLQQDDFDLLLIDISMPVLDGLDTTRQLRQQERNGHIPVIALTGYALTEYQRAAEEAGMNDFLHKPFDYTELYQAIMQALQHHTYSSR